MKYFLIFLFLGLSCFSHPLWAQIDSVGNGGDPMPMESSAFPKKELLNEAVQYLKEQVKQSRFMERFKDEFVGELDQLFSDNKFRYIEAILVELPGQTPGGYTSLVSLGAKTTMKPGSVIYLTKQVISYSKEDLARVIAQEIPHHVLFDDIATNEDLVNHLGKLLASGAYDETTNEALRLSYLKKEYQPGSEIRAEYGRVKEAYAYIKGMPLEEVRSHDELEDDLKIIVICMHNYYEKKGWPDFSIRRALDFRPGNCDRYRIRTLLQAILDARYSEKDLSNIHSPFKWSKS